jgi:NAD(P)-dependent dehydrogenase (short-subunit alcohol dehydrogenase family)
MGRLENKIAIVTGAGSGMGWQSQAVRLKKAPGPGAASLRRRFDRLRALSGVTPVQANVTAQADVDTLVQTAEGLGGIDILVNNAGIMDAFLPVGEVTDAVWQRVLAVNLTGPMMLSRAVLPAMLNAGRGVIINVSSAAGLSGGKAGAAYTASKHGLVGLTKSIATAYAVDGIRCVAITPARSIRECRWAAS